MEEGIPQGTDRSKGPNNVRVVGEGAAFKPAALSVYPGHRRRKEPKVAFFQHRPGTVVRAGVKANKSPFLG